MSEAEQGASGEVDQGLEATGMEAGHGVGEEPEVGSGEEVRSSEEPEVGSDEEAEVESGEELSEESEAEEASPEQLLAMGKKCLAASDAIGAVDHFQEACSLLAEAHGQVGKELAEPYYLYGQALLELAREKSAVFGKGIPVSGGADEAGSSTADGTGSSAEAASTSPGEAGASSSAPGEAGASSSAPGEAGASSSAPGEAGASSSAPGEAGAEAKSPAEGEGEEESDLQLSWEILECARVICQREGDDKHRLMLSDVNLALGEVGMESDQYEQAIVDLQSSLRLREFLLEPTDRRIAEVHFNLGMAYTLARQTDQAITAYNASKTLLSQRKEVLKSQIAGENDVTQQEKLHCEIRELGELIPDLESKIADIEDLKTVLQERGNEPEECIGFDAPSSELASDLSAVAPVNDITHLMRKRKVGSEAVDDYIATKKVCTETVSSTNGYTEEREVSPCRSVPVLPTSEQ